MPSSDLSSAGLDARRRRVLFRARRRGLREMDLVLGAFVDMNLATMDEADVSEFERLLDVPDPQFLAWITGEEATPSQFDTPLLRRLRSAPGEARLREAART
jgi:antitoxin CptB